MPREPVKIARIAGSCNILGIFFFLVLLELEEGLVVGERWERRIKMATAARHVAAPKKMVDASRIGMFATMVRLCSS